MWLNVSKNVAPILRNESNKLKSTIILINIEKI